MVRDAHSSNNALPAPLGAVHVVVAVTLWGGRALADHTTFFSRINLLTSTRETIDHVRIRYVKTSFVRRLVAVLPFHKYSLKEV